MTNSPENELFDYSPITERPPISWPGGARVAAYVGLNVEHFLLDRPSTSIWPGTADLVPDALNYGWRDYGARVGIWRTIESLDRHGIRPSVLLNSDGRGALSADHQGRPEPELGLARARPDQLDPAHRAWTADEERQVLADIVETIASATGRRPHGWMGPGLTETFHTPKLLAELGLSYLLDWTNDDQPYPLNVPGMISVPYSVELNDLGLFTKGTTGPEFVQIVKDQYDQLHADSAHSGRVMALALHPFVTGQPFRAKYLDQALEYLAAQPDIWLTTSDEIAEHFVRTR